MREEVWDENLLLCVHEARHKATEIGGVALWDERKPNVQETKLENWWGKGSGPGRLHKS